MPDWAGQDGTPTELRYRWMAEREVRGYSPSYEAICLGVADDADVLAQLDTLPPAKRQPNLLLGAVRYLGGPVDSWPAFRAFVLAEWPELAATMLARRTQTNEPNRCACLLPVLTALPQPLALLEVGASAGLCLYPDRYAYRYERSDGTVTTLGASSVEFPCTLDGRAPDGLPRVVWRAGLDLHPLDVTADEDVRWLEALVWPEQVDRLARLRGAVTIARAEPPRIVTGDLVTDLHAVADEAPHDATLVVFHSAVLAYLDGDARTDFAGEVGELAARRRTCWISNEAPGVLPGTAHLRDETAPRFVLARDGVPLALTGPHGQSFMTLSG